MAVPFLHSLKHYMKMRRSILAVPLLCAHAVSLLCALAVSAQIPAAATAPISPAQQRVALAQTAIEKNPEYPQHYNDLALALTRRARETADPAYYGRAEEALQKSFHLAPDNFEGQKIRVQILLGRHEFALGLELAKELNRRVGDDISVYGFIADAAIELGNYKEAEEARFGDDELSLRDNQP